MRLLCKHHKVCIRGTPFRVAHVRLHSSLTPYNSMADSLKGLQSGHFQPFSHHLTSLARPSAGQLSTSESAGTSSSQFSIPQHLAFEDRRVIHTVHLNFGLLNQCMLFSHHLHRPSTPIGRAFMPMVEADSFLLNNIARCKRGMTKCIKHMSIL